jgi:structural maintenance of chromosome 4
MKAFKDQYEEFERKDAKYREDLKHLKQKIKKLEGERPKLQEPLNEEEVVLR